MSLTHDLNRLVWRPPFGNRLDPAANPDAIRAKTGLERKLADDADLFASSEEVTAESSDGLFTFIVRVVRG